MNRLWGKSSHWSGKSAGCIKSGPEDFRIPDERTGGNELKSCMNKKFFRLTARNLPKSGRNPKKTRRTVHSEEKDKKTFCELLLWITTVIEAKKLNFRYANIDKDGRKEKGKNEFPSNCCKDT